MSPLLIIVLAMSTGVVVILGALALTLGHRARRRSLPDDVLAAELRELRQSIDALTVEVERVGESQRFTARLLNDATTMRATFPSPPAKTVTPH